MKNRRRALQHEFITAKFAKFLFAGGLAALANIFSRVMLSQWMHYIPAIICAYIVGLATAYTLNRAFVLLLDAEVGEPDDGRFLPGENANWAATTFIL